MLNNKNNSLLAIRSLSVLVMVVLLSVSYDVKAQTNSVNAFSPYTMYGIGELHTQGTTQMRSMGGIGVAWRSSDMVSLLNPAGYSATARKGFMFNVGVEGNFLRNQQNKYDPTGLFLYRDKDVRNTVNVREIAVQFPLAKGLGMGVSVTPYSSVGYNVSSQEESEDIWGLYGRAAYSHYGEGDVSEVKAGLGWEIIPGFSLGIAAKYYWGNLTHNYVASIIDNYVGETDPYTTISVKEYAISDFKFQVGLQWNMIQNNKRILTLGATYDYGGLLRNKQTESIYINDLLYSSVFIARSRGKLRLPHAVTVGLTYQDAKFVAGVDYDYKAWSANKIDIDGPSVGGLTTAYTDTHTIKVGLEYTPNRFDVRKYLRRIHYRIGFRMGNCYQTVGDTKINEYAATAGLGFPLKFLGATNINIGLEYGRRGNLASVETLTQRVGLVRQDYFKINIGFSLFGEDYWFVRPKFD